MSKESFEPLNANHGNVDGRISYFRDRFLSAEMDYFKALMQDESNREIFASYLDYPPDMLFKEAMGRIKLIEYGNRESDKRRHQIHQGWADWSIHSSKPKSCGKWTRSVLHHEETGGDGL